MTSPGSMLFDRDAGIDAAALPAHPRRATQGSHRVLVAADDDAFREIFGKILDPPQFEVTAVNWSTGVVEPIVAARTAGEPFAIVVVKPGPTDTKPYGALERLRDVDPDLQVVVCVAEPPAPSHGWQNPSPIAAFIEEPLAAGQVRQLLQVVADKWTLLQVAHRTRGELESLREKAALLDKVPDAIFVQDLDGRLLSWNPGAERLYGRTAGDVLGCQIQSLLGSDPKQITACVRNTLENGSCSGEYAQRHADGRELTVESYWTLLHNENGDATSLLIINTDITIKKQLAMKSIRAQRLETIGTLTGGIAHDLNNVLQPITMAMDLFRSQLTDPRSQNVLNIVSRNAERAADLIKQVLSFARSVEGERQLIHPASLVGEIASVVRNTFPKNIEFCQPAVVEPWMLLGDSTQLCQALLHLCMNSRDAMVSGGTLTISVKNLHIDQHFASLHSDATAGNFIVMSVTDTGIGIPERLREKVFDPFFTTKEPGQGAGVGLATTLTIVRSHGGFLTLNSREGRGTTVRLFLPAVQDAPSGSERGRTPREKIAPAEVPGDGKLILLVDDEPSVLAVMKLALEKAGYRVFVAGNGAEGLRVYEQQQAEIDIVITDMVMPAMDGPTMIAAIKKLNPQIKIIAMTGMSTIASIETVKQLGVECILSKPCNSKKMLSTVREVLDR